ncbi:polysaccharide pyruvyl transferase family protein [Mordavella massiliensis]|uniref:Polysaccharide pyruvyl transferase family protein n=1 Tax=Mordavella massiliensis TaxID=1871024 RepID=A0A938XCQ8_9CLOT|nr:polysaccharide pyruvyl transferase family protein [Mordavella massiliensis]MBM6949113.1 polysaccharide pyruvyl transferase family protein [Mordavella massiliensis]
MYDNFGDYLLFAKVRNEIKKCDNSINVYSANISPFYNEFVDYKPLKRKEDIKCIDCAILAGGGYFGEPKQYRLYWNIRMLFRHARVAYKFIKRKIPYSIIGVGVGPLSYKFSQKIVKKIFDNAKIISVRDAESREYLRKYGVKKKIEVVPDWVMACGYDEIIKDEYKDIREEYKNKILIHLASKNKGKDSPIEIIIQDIRKLAKEYGKQFLIITDQADSSNSQIERAKQLKDKLKDIHVDLYEYHNPYELIKIIQSAECVLTDKLHVGIVATRLGVPAFSVAGQVKIHRFYKQIGREEFCIPIQNVKKGYVFQWIIEHGTEAVKIDKVVESAQMNINLLHDFLYKYL